MSYSTKCLIDEMSFRRNMFRLNAMDPITSNLSSEMEKSGFLASLEVDVCPRKNTFKHIAEWGKSKQRVVIRMCQHMEVWFFNPLCSNGLSHTD